MAKHENPQRPAEIFYPPGHPRHKPPTPRDVENAAKATVAEREDLGDIIRALVDLANELHTEFFNVPGAADDGGFVDPKNFDAATRLAFVSCGNALDYAIRLVSEKGRAERILRLRRELAEEMRAAGLTGDPLDGESASQEGGE